MGDTANSGTQDIAGLDFLDFLFTVSMGIGLTPELLQVTTYKGILQEGWVLSSQYPNGEEVLHLLTFFLGFLTLTFSWYGYHGSLSTRPLKYTSGKDMFRFVLDVVLVILYGVMLIAFKNLDVVITLLFVVFLIYTIWDLTKYFSGYFDGMEAGKVVEMKRRTRVTFLWTLVSGLILLFHFCCHFDWEVWVTVSAALTSVILYRVNKFQKFFPPLNGQSTEPGETPVVAA